MSESNLESRERLVKLETNVQHIDANLKQVINNTTLQHDTLLKLTEAVERLSEAMTDYKHLENNVSKLETNVDDIRKQIEEQKINERVSKIEKKYLIITTVFIGMLIGILFTMIPATSYPAFILKLLGIPV